jgi:hypothetical protein
MITARELKRDEIEQVWKMNSRRMVGVQGKV